MVLGGAMTNEEFEAVIFAVCMRVGFRAAETESADHRDCRATGGQEVLRVSLACQGHKASADKPA